MTKRHEALGFRQNTVRRVRGPKGIVVVVYNDTAGCGSFMGAEGQVTMVGSLAYVLQMARQFGRPVSK